MKKRLISEAFNVVNGNLTTSKGNFPIAYIDPQTSENTYPYKDILKDKFGARFLTDGKTFKAWGWFLGNDPMKVYKNVITPAVEYLTSIEDGGQGTRKDKVIQIIDELIDGLGSGSVSNVGTRGMKDVQNELIQFKADLVNSVSSEEFMRRMGPIIKFSQAQGHRYSLGNTILIYVQDPQATFVKSNSQWFKLNRQVVNKSNPILLWRPNSVKLDANEKAKIKQDYLTSVGAKSVRDLSPGQKDELRVQLSGGEVDSTARTQFTWYFAYDIRFTKVIEGKEDLAGDPTADYEWYDKSDDKSEFLSLFIKAAKKMIEDSPIKINYQDSSQMGGARGSATNKGEINLASDAEDVKNYASTICHEFAHQALHIGYMKKASDGGDYNDWARFYVGTKQGRDYIEQQAEICAWIVLKYFGFDVTTSATNYAAGWGMTDAKSAAKVFDSVAAVASKMIETISNNIQEINDLENNGTQEAQ
jgi:hypothetical protein